MQIRVRTETGRELLPEVLQVLQDSMEEKDLLYISFGWKMVCNGDNSGYKAFVTDDLSTVNGRFRHGTVMRLSKQKRKQFWQLMEKMIQGPVMDEKYWQTLISTMTVQDSPVRMPRQKVLIH